MVQSRGLKGAAAPLFSKESRGNLIRKVSFGFFYGSLEPIFSFKEKTGLRKKGRLACNAKEKALCSSD